MVFFADKEGTPFSIDQPGEFLSQRALERRNRQQVNVNDSDLPVSPDYIQAVSELGIPTFYTTKWMNGVLTTMADSMVSTVQNLPFVTSVEYVAPGNPLTSAINRRKNDPGVMAGTSQTADATDFQNEMLGIDDMHVQGFTGEGILIGVFDGGFINVPQLDVFRHLFQDNRVLLKEDFITGQSDVWKYGSHGTRVLSVLAGRRGGEYTGTAPDASYLLFITEDVSSEYRIEEYNWLFAAEKADSMGVDIISTSLGYSIFDDPAMDYTHDDLDGETAVITIASNMAASKGVFLVNSAGNEGNDAWRLITPPADGEQVLAVGAVTSSLNRSGFSSLGPAADQRIKPDVAALGSGTAVVTFTGMAANHNGTSFATPIVAGLVAGLWQAFPDLTNTELLNIIRESGSISDSPNNQIGYGIPDFSRAYSLATSSTQTSVLETTVYPNPVPAGLGHFYITFDERMDDDEVMLQLLTAGGEMIQTFNVQPDPFQRSFQLLTDDLPSGIYVLNIRSGSGRETRKLVKY